MRPLRLALYMFASVLPVILILYVPVQAATAIRVRMYIAKTIVNAPLQQNSGWLQMYQRQLANKERVLANLKANNARQSEIDDAEWERNQLLAMIAQLQPPPPSTVIINQPYWRAIVERVCFPGSTTSWGSIQMPDGSIVTYPPPPQLQSYAGSWRWGQTVNPSQQLFQTIGCAVLYMMLLPVTFVLLPASRRIAKVKWAHVWRVAAYSVTMIVVAVTAVGATVLFVDGAFGWSGAIVAVEYVGVATWFFAAWWWAVAIRHYLRMPHAGAIAGLMSLMLALLMSPCLLSILPRWISTMIVG